MFVVPLLPHADFGPNDRENATHFIYPIFDKKNYISKQKWSHFEV